MQTVVLANDVTASAGDMLIFEQSGKAVVIPSWALAKQDPAISDIVTRLRALGEPQQQPAPVQSSLGIQPRHHYSKRRRLVVRDHATVEAQRQRIIDFAANRQSPFTTHDIAASFFSGKLSSSDRRLTSIRDDCRRLVELGLLVVVDPSAKPLAYAATK